MLSDIGFRSSRSSGLEPGPDGLGLGKGSSVSGRGLKGRKE